jgi:predicted AlkP superfamily pyrophosphatase or phosphodiesterase
MSVFHSVPPTRHESVTNDWKPMRRPILGLVDVAAAAGFKSAFFYNWEPLRNLSRPKSLALSYFRDNYHDVDGDQVIANECARIVANERFDFVFVYLGTLDTAGHACGWMSDEYFAQLQRVDDAFGAILDALPKDYAIVLQSDHGGHAKNHGTDLPEDMTIPWIAAGPGIRGGHTLRAPVSLLDTAPTIVRMLGIAPPTEWEGHVIAEILE